MEENKKQHPWSFIALRWVVIFFTLFTCGIILMPTTLLVAQSQTILVTWLVLWILIIFTASFYAFLAKPKDKDAVSQEDQIEVCKVDTICGEMQDIHRGEEWV